MDSFRLTLRGNLCGDYTGEADEYNRAHGVGEFRTDKGLIWKGTFFESQISGLCKQSGKLTSICV